MKKHFAKISIFLIVALLILGCALSFVSCNKKRDDEIDINYGKDNDFENVQMTRYVVNQDADEAYQYGAEIYTPKDVEAKYGVIFFVGTAIEPRFYSYLGKALAKQGYIAAIAFMRLNMAYGFYSESETIAKNVMAMYPGARFFVGGHSQGGGAAMRFVCENDDVVGAIFFSPLCYAAHNLENPDYDPFDPDSERYILDDEGNPVFRFDTLASSTLPVLLLEADKDHVLDKSMKEDALSRMPSEYMHYVLSPASHMGFCYLEEINAEEGETHYVIFGKDGKDLTEDDQKRQLENTLLYTLHFLQNTVASLN